MKIKYQSNDFSEQKISRSYICYNVDGTELTRYDVDNDGYSIREVVIDGRYIPQNKLDDAFALKDKFFGGVRIK